MKSVRVTIKDIAANCGYSANTVSRALRSDPHLSESTRQLIRDTARKMGYIPNTMAASLRSGRSRMIAVIVNDLHNLHYCDLINRMDALLRRENYTLMILCMQLDDSLAEKLIHTAISLSVDGILYFPSFGQQSCVDYMIRNQMPFVLLDRRVGNVEADLVRCDDEQGGYLAGRHLAELGHKEFLFLSGVEKSSSQVDRLSGFLHALADCGIPRENVRVIPGSTVEDAFAHERIEQLVFPLDYTAIVSFRDEISYPVMQILRERGVSIPDDVSIISFDNLRACDPSRPLLTSIYAANENIAELGVKMLLERIGNPELPPRNIVLPVKIFDQGTTAAPNSS